jgi:predicted AAA+ superfamily ATPase
MYSRLIKSPANKSFFLFGPRGTGKTTWVKATFPASIYIDLLEARLFNDLLANPQRLENLIPANYKDWVIIDEVQRIPDILNEVHRLIEKSGFKFVLTGSSARKLRRAGPNLLAGRALTYSLYPLTAIELGEDFDPEFSLKYGHLPSAVKESHPQKYLDSYVKTYLEEEVKYEGLTRNLSSFSRFLEAASFSQGSVLNITKVAQECAVQRKVVENYFTILEDLLIGYRLPVFTKKAKRRLTAHPKFYFFDVGVYRTIRPMGPLDLPEEAEGAAFETLLFQELMAVNHYLDLGYSLYYWRTSNNYEVDFVLYGKKGIKAFEVKRTDRISGSMFTGLNSFIRDYPTANAYFIYGGDRYMREHGIEIIPFTHALKNLAAILEKTG